jgi:hypothetical protein
LGLLGDSLERLKAAVKYLEQYDTPDWLDEVFPICDVNNVEYGEEYGDEEVSDSLDVDG